jgi:hypothetical protein
MRRGLGQGADHTSAGGRGDEEWRGGRPTNARPHTSKGILKGTFVREKGKREEWKDQARVADVFQGSLGWARSHGGRQGTKSVLFGSVVFRRPLQALQAIVTVYMRGYRQSSGRWLLPSAGGRPQLTRASTAGQQCAPARNGHGAAHAGRAGKCRTGSPSACLGAPNWHCVLDSGWGPRCSLRFELP